MLKFREGKLMILIMVLIFAIATASSFIMPNYDVNGYYKFAIWFFLCDLVILALCQVYFASKLYKIAAEQSKVSSKTETVDDSEDESN